MTAPDDAAIRSPRHFDDFHIRRRLTPLLCHYAHADLPAAAFYSPGRCVHVLPAAIIDILPLSACHLPSDDVDIAACCCHFDAIFAHAIIPSSHFRLPLSYFRFSTANTLTERPAQTSPLPPLRGQYAA